MVVGHRRDLGADLERDRAEVVNRVPFVDDLAHTRLVRVVPPRVAEANADDSRALVHQLPHGGEHLLRVERSHLGAGLVDGPADAGYHLRPDETSRYHVRRPISVEVVFGSRTHQQPRLRAPALNDDVRADGRRQPEHGRLAQQPSQVRAKCRRACCHALQYARRDIVRCGGHFRCLVRLSIREEPVGERPADIQVDGVHQSCSPQNGLS